jgi:hypothetical protein
MALYKYASYLQQLDNDAFDLDHSPGSQAPYAGIYQCTGCGREIAIAQSHVLPPQNHHEHTADQGPIRWRLIVFADHNPK